MTDLTNEILSDITAFEMASIDAEGSVIRAHMEATMRDIQIHMECQQAGIVMESDDWDGEIVPKRNDENIFIYIFLFIPRLIRNLFRKIKAWWTDKKQEGVAKELAKHEEESFKTIGKGGLEICAEVNSKIKGGGHLVYTGSHFAYMSRIKNPNGVLETYAMFAKRFELYKEDVLSFIDFTENGQVPHEAFEKIMVAVERESVVPSINDLISDDYVTELIDDQFVEIVTEHKKEIKDLADTCIHAMEEIETYYKKLIAVPHMSDANKTLMTRYMKQIEKICNIFNRFDIITRDELADALEAFDMKRKLVASWRKRLIDDQSNPSARKDTEEKLDKWGVR